MRGPPRAPFQPRPTAAAAGSTTENAAPGPPFPGRAGVGGDPGGGGEGGRWGGGGGGGAWGRAGRRGWNVTGRRTEEVGRPDSAANTRQRCFFCKSELYDRLAAVAGERGATLLDGFNRDDRADWRPGR